MRGRFAVVVVFVMIVASIAISQQQVSASVNCANVIQQGNSNYVVPTVSCATVGGGADNSIGSAYSTIGGGQQNTITTNSGATIGGGIANRNIGVFATIGGGTNNLTEFNASTVGGGNGNRARAGYATVGGGGRISPNDGNGGNWVTDSYGTIAGGGDNRVGDADGSSTNDPFATVGGGAANRAIVAYATISGGQGNLANGIGAAVAGGASNTASGLYAMVAGGAENQATGAYSLASGRNAKALSGSFVWADSHNFEFASTLPNQFSVRATNGARFITGVNASSGAAVSGVQLAPGGGSWSTLSDRASKANFVSVDPQAVLSKLASIPVQVWNYKSQDASIHHIGPMAQDFSAAFGVGEDNTHISTVDADGVALAAIQGLNQENQQLKARVAALEHGAPVMADPMIYLWLGIGGTLGVLVLMLLAGLTGYRLRARRTS